MDPESHAGLGPPVSLSGLDSTHASYDGQIFDNIQRQGVPRKEDSSPMAEVDAALCWAPGRLGQGGPVMMGLESPSSIVPWRWRPRGGWHAERSLVADGSEGRVPTRSKRTEAKEAKPRSRPSGEQRRGLSRFSTGHPLSHVFFFSSYRGECNMVVFLVRDAHGPWHLASSLRHWPQPAAAASLGCAHQCRLRM